MRKFYFLCIIVLFLVLGKAEAITVDDLVGTYNETTTGYYWDSNASAWADDYYQTTITITKVDETTIKMSGLYSYVEAIGTVDLAAMTITFDVTTVPISGYDYLFTSCPYYTADQKTAPIVATISADGNTISIDSWSIIYDYGDAEYYVVNVGYTTLAKNGASSITKVTAAESDSPVYNLSGVRMTNTDNLPKGIYISGGKKFVVK